MASLKNTTVAGTDSAQLPVGTTAQRPGSPVTGDLRFNSTLKVVEYYNGSDWITTPSYVKTDLGQYVDAAISDSYSGSGTTWSPVDGQGVNLTLQNGVGYSTDNGGCLVFDGTNDFVNASDNSALDSGSGPELTINCWYNADSTGGHLISKGGNLGWRLRTFSDQIIFYDRGATNIHRAYFLPTTGVWINLCIVGDSSGIRTYRNGLLIGSNGTAFGAGNNSYDLEIGCTEINPNTNSGQRDFFDGKIGLVQIYQRALSTTEIWQNFQTYRGRYGV